MSVSKNIIRLSKLRPSTKLTVYCVEMIKTYFYWNRILLQMFFFYTLAFHFAKMLTLPTLCITGKLDWIPCTNLVELYYFAFCEWITRRVSTIGKQVVIWVALHWFPYRATTLALIHFHWEAFKLVKQAVKGPRSYNFTVSGVKSLTCVIWFCH